MIWRLNLLSADGWGRCFIVTAALLWSLSGLFGKAPWFSEWPAETRGLGLAFWRALGAALFMLPFVRRPSFRLAMIPMGLSFAMMTSLFLTSMVIGSESNTIWLQYLAPVWVLLAGKLGWTDPPRPGDRVLIVTAIGGLSWILFFELAGGRPLSTILAIVSGWSFAIVLICLRKLRNENGPWLLFISHTTTAICLAPLALTQVPWPSLFQLAVLLLFAIAQLGLPYLLFTWGLKRISSQEAALLSLLEPITLPVWTFIAWHNYADYSAPDWWTMVGATMIACGFIGKYGREVFRHPLRTDDPHPENFTH